MEHTKPEIDTAKLRRLMSERNRAFDQARDLTDRFMEIRTEISRFEAAINQPGRHIDKISRDREIASLQAIKDEKDQIQADREANRSVTQSYGYVENLIDHARRLGLVVDTSRCTVRRAHKGEPKRVPV
mgnify:CR=1 FL=1